MPGGIYSALSGMQVRMQDLDRVASDLANASTSGYKAERAATTAAERHPFARALDSAIDVVNGERKVDFTPGVMSATGRDLDVALDGSGFFAIETPEGVRYTRDGAFVRRSDGVLTTRDGNPVLGEDGDIRLGNGPVKIAEDGTIQSGGTVAGRLKVVDFSAPGDITRESGVRFRATSEDVAPATASARIVPGALEAANVSVVERMAALTEITRAFEGLQRGISVLANDVDGRAITELGRR
jgi:flagellar basal-body rod protein FlgF